jgi:hypothetical protein
MDIRLCLSAFVLTAPTVAAAEPTIILEVPAGAEACGVFQDGRTPAVELALKCRIRFRAGSHEFPIVVGDVPFDLIETLEFGPDAAPGSATTPGLFKLGVEGGAWEPGVQYYSLRFQQDWSVGGEPLHLQDWGGMWFRTVDGVADPPVFRLDEERISQESIFYGQLAEDPTRTIRFSSCSYADLPLWKIEVSFEGGHQALLHERYRVPMAGSGPAQLVEGEVWLGDEHAVQTSYWKLVYAAEHHNWNEQYWMLFDAPLKVGEIEEVHGLFLQEGFIEIPRRAALLGSKLEEIAPLEILKYDQVLDKDPIPPAFLRGDVLSDGMADISDAIAVLSSLFLGTGPLACPDAADADDTGKVDMIDVVVILEHLFLEGPPLAPPATACGDDPTPDALGCEVGCKPSVN